MKSLGITKFKKLNPREGYLASYIQLPWGCKTDLIGRTVEIFECEGGFFLKMEGEEFKQELSHSLDERVTNLESELLNLKNLLKLKNTPGRIRTAVAGSKVLHD